MLTSVQRKLRSHSDPHDNDSNSEGRFAVVQNSINFADHIGLFANADTNCRKWKTCTSSMLV